MSVISISTDAFYGPPSIKERKICAIIDKSKSNGLRPAAQLPKYLNRLLGPSRTWKIFKKQADVIEYTRSRSNQLMSFAFEQSSGQRSFLACHPIMLWFINNQRPQELRCSYEIIVEHTPCKLYLDIEFEFNFNNLANGDRMLETIKTILCAELQSTYGLSTNKENIIDLESSTSAKFSHHLIFQLTNRAFVNNYSVGNFVQGICDNILVASKDPTLMETLCDKYGITKEAILELIVNDRKGLQKVFIDVSVYSKNRHFRLFGHTKLNKNAPLVLSGYNKFVTKGKEEYDMFLSSLVTYFSEEIQILLKCGSEKQSHCVSEKVEKTRFQRNENILKSISSVEDFISQFIGPMGHIRRSLRSGYRIFYDITGYRFCENIGREHRSNNIRLSIDLQQMILHQTCYDPDCKGFISKPYPLPSNLRFEMDDDQIFLDVSDNMLSDQDLLDFIDSNFFDTSYNAISDEEIDSTILSVDEKSFEKSSDDLNIEHISMEKDSSYFSLEDEVELLEVANHVDDSFDLISEFS